MRKRINNILILFMMIVIYCILLTIINCIPQNAIKYNVSESANHLNNQGNSWYIYIAYKNIYIKFDNHTDALMLNTIYSIDNDRPFYSAMMARKNFIKDKTEIIYSDTIGELRSSSKYDSLDQIGDLNDTVNNDTIESFEYARYWHGYLILLRPLLVLFNITQIRILFIVLFIILAIIFFCKLFKTFDVSTLIIFIWGFIVCDYFYIGYSLQGSFVFFIVIFSSILIIGKRINNFLRFFMIIGSLTAFFDFLTTPIITLTIPLLIFILYETNGKFNLKKIIIELIKYSIWWSIGYFGTFIAKWVIVDLLYNRQIIKSSLLQFQFRSVIKDISSYNYAIESCQFVFNNVLLIGLFFVIVLLIIKIFNYFKFKKFRLNIRRAFVFLIPSFICFIWILILKQHTFKHIYFTYRNILVIIISLFLSIHNMFEIDNTLLNHRLKKR